MVSVTMGKNADHYLSLGGSYGPVVHYRIGTPYQSTHSNHVARGAGGVKFEVGKNTWPKMYGYCSGVVQPINPTKEALDRRRKCLSFDMYVDGVGGVDPEI